MAQEEIKEKIREREAQKIIRGHHFERGSKSAVIYVLLAYFTCVIGLHNFYAGYYKKGIVQLVLTIVSPFFMFVPLLIVSLWGLGEMLFVNKSANGVTFRGNLVVIWGLRLIGIAFFIYQFVKADLIL